MKNVAAPTLDPLPGPYRFRQHLQIGRLFTYTLACVVALSFKLTGIFYYTEYWIVIAFMLLADLSALLLRGLYGTRPRPLLMNLVDRAWLVFDFLWVTFAVWVTGGTDSPWYVWYLAPMAAAAFILELREVALMAAIVIAAYLGGLYFMGDIRGFDATFFVPLQRIVFMIGAAIYFLMGIVDLRHKREIVKRMREDESRKVAELARLNAALDQRTQELAEASARVGAASHQKSRFLASMSHELRTPLNSIIGFSEILGERIEEPRQLGFVTNIHASGEHLLGLINDILDLSKVEAGRMELAPETISLPGMIGSVAEIMKGMATKRHIGLTLDLPDDLPLMDADPVKLKQILYNLASNAVKYSPDGAEVTIAAAALEASANSLGVDAMEIRVTDHGAGISPADQSLIFEEFRQGADSQGKEGTGLGLTLVKKFTELHGGAIRVESAPGAGCAFLGLLPLHCEAGTVAPTPPHAPVTAGDHRQRILVVEDDPAGYDVISLALIAAGYLPIAARTGEEALHFARTLVPAAITLDLMLPDMDGWELLRALKARPETARIPVIVVSLSDNRELGLALGVDDYFVKPADLNQLVGRVRELTTARATVLLIDDDPHVHALFDEVLVAAGFRVDHAAGGAAGLASAQSAPPDLVVLDVMMEGMSGFEVAGRLKADPRTAAVPILVHSALELGPDEHYRLRGKIAGLMQKDGRHPARIEAVVHELLARRGASHDQ